MPNELNADQWDINSLTKIDLHQVGGGLLLHVRNEFTTKRSSFNLYSSFEVIDYTLSIHKNALLVKIVYRPPYFEKQPVIISSFIDEFYSFLKSGVFCNEPMIITTDFNIHMDDLSESKQFSDLLYCTSLIQHIHDPTYEKGHTLDFVISRSYDHIISSKPVAEEFFSYHFSISYILSLPNIQLQNKEVTILPITLTYNPSLMTLPLLTLVKIHLMILTLS